jgi:excisionase family DNA binding protein
LWLWGRFGDQLVEAIERFEKHGDPRTAAALRFALAEIETAAAGVSVSVDLTPDVSAAGNAETAVGVVVAASSVHCGSPRLTPAEAADSTGLSDRQIRNLCADGRLEATKDRRGSWEIDASSVHGYAARKRSR